MLTQEKSQSQAPQVWDKPTASAQIGDYFRVPFVPVMQVVDRDVLQDGRVWLLVTPSTGSYTEEWILEPEPPAPEQQQPEQKPQKEPVGEAGDSVRSSLQPTPSAPTEFEMGRQHGRANEAERLHPIYTKPSREYAISYLEGYHDSSSQQQPAPTQPVEWSVTYDPKWRWYQAWVKDRCIGHGSTPEQAEHLQRFLIEQDTLKE